MERNEKQKQNISNETDLQIMLEDEETKSCALNGIG